MWAVGVALSVVLAAERAPRPALTVVAQGADVGQAELDAAPLPVDLRRASLPNTPGTVKPLLPAGQEHIAAARQAYVNADFQRCLTELGDDSAVFSALEAGDRLQAARLVLWRVACDVGAGRLDSAKRTARQFAVWSLQVPAEAGSVSPEVEAVIARALREAQSLRVLPLPVGGTLDAVVEVDGRPAGCSTPCTVELIEGTHWVRLSADGHESASKQVRVQAPVAELKLELPAASPELASAQWSARFQGAADIEGARSVRLLASALRAGRLVLLNVQPGSGGKMSGLLAIDGDIAARAERPTGQLHGLLEDLLVRGQVIEAAVPLYRRPLFWVAVLGAATVAAGGTALALLLRPGARVTF